MRGIGVFAVFYGALLFEFDFGLEKFFRAVDFLLAAFEIVVDCFSGGGGGPGDFLAERLYVLYLFFVSRFMIG